MPDEAEVDSEVSELFVLLSPVDNEPMPVDADVDRLAMLLAVVLMPVLSCETVTASCGAEPSATFVMRRRAVALPTDTSDSGAAVPVR
ncbi:putative chromosome segregation ATPase [Burkholderia sp. ABCPW 111]|nr:putative chromosome segregation ATPase [Burkholderia sp. ABCPW 111]